MDSTHVDVNAGDRVDVDVSGLSRWATVTEVHTAGVTVRHRCGTVRTYLFGRVLDVEYARCRR